MPVAAASPRVPCASSRDAARWTRPSWPRASTRPRPVCTTRGCCRTRRSSWPRRAGPRAGESVLVLGDFDADGLTGLAILVEALRWLGLPAEPYVPDRTAEGHGLSMAAVTRAREAGHRLIVTADTGSTSVAEVAAAALQASTSSSPTTTSWAPPGPPRWRS